MGRNTLLATFGRFGLLAAALGVSLLAGGSARAQLALPYQGWANLPNRSAFFVGNTGSGGFALNGSCANGTGALGQTDTGIGVHGYAQTTGWGVLGVSLSGFGVKAS